MIKNFLTIIILFFILTLPACKDDDEKASIVGKWEGEQSQIQFTPAGSPFPLYNETDEDFNTQLEFLANGSVTLTSGSQTSTGTYEVQGDKLITTLSLDIQVTDLTGTFTIKKLSHTILELYLEDERQISIPDVGDFNGKIKATFVFNRVSH